MRTFHETDIRKRTLGVSLALAAWFAVLLLRLVQLQVVEHAGLRDRAMKQSQARIPVRASRGDILDRNHRVLASSLPVYTIKLGPVDKETTAQEADKVRRLQSVLDLTGKEVVDILRDLRENEKFTYVRKQVSPDVAARVRTLKLPGVGFDEESRRFYPNGALAAHVLGGVNPDGSRQAGVEARYNEVLKGVDGAELMFKDNKRRGYLFQPLKPPQPGRSIVLTIDATIQYIAERALARAVADHAASSGTVIVMDPATGEILALANWPTYDPNAYSDAAGAWLDLAVGGTYEPGSTFKIVAASAALERGVVSYSDMFDCTAGTVKVGPLTISDHERMGVLSFPEVLIRSSNVGTVKFSARLAAADLYAMIRRFGFGARTGVDLPAEEPGFIRPAAKWTKVISQPHIAIGYEVRVTPLQVVRAMNVFATGGRLVRPHVFLSFAGEAPAPLVGPRPDDQILDAGLVSGLVGRVFERVVEEGTAKSGRMDEFWAAGKTGTAQKLDPVLKVYTTKSHTASFAGFVPSRRPVLSMIVVLDDIKEGEYYGGQACAPVFRDIARQVLRYLGVVPDRAPLERPLTAELGKGGRP
jgi:cell division protein FtsI (penicillin-binding protein 3)